MDQGIISCFKGHYCRGFIQHSVNCYDINITPSEIYKINQLQAMYLANIARQEVDMMIIRNCWYKASIMPTMDLPTAPTQPAIPISSLLHHPSWTCTTTIGLRVIPLDDMPSTTSTPLINHPSVFEVLNLFRACWFLNCEHLMSLTLAAVKGSDNNDIIWIDLLPSSHTYLLHQAKNLAPPSYPLSLLKRVMFTFLLEVINS